MKYEEASRWLENNFCKKINDYKTNCNGCPVSPICYDDLSNISDIEERTLIFENGIICAAEHLKEKKITAKNNLKKFRIQYLVYDKQQLNGEKPLPEIYWDMDDYIYAENEEDAIREALDILDDECHKNSNCRTCIDYDNYRLIIKNENDEEIESYENFRVTENSIDEDVFLEEKQNIF